MLSQNPDFVGHDRETAALIAGAGRFDGGLEGEKVGLAGDILDDGGNPCHFPGIGG